MSTNIIEEQREAIKKAHNARFVIDGHEYRIKYEGGIGEIFEIYGRLVGARYYKPVVGFSGMKLYSKAQVIAMAKEMVRKDAKEN